jgi:hypothetical protein
MNDKPVNIDVHFFQLVFSLQTAAMQQMGKIVSPVTGKVERDLTMAKTTIDILGMLEKKMKGNMSPEETKFIGQSLHELRMNYVDETKKGNKPGGNGPTEAGDDNPSKKTNGNDN